VIIEVGPGATVPVPSDATVVDLSGFTVLPGLTDLHTHFGSPDLEARRQPDPTTLPRMLLDTVRFAPGHRRVALEHGVTTVRNLGDEHRWIMDLRRQINDGTLEGPRMFASGPLFTAAGGHPIATFGVDPASDVVRVPVTPDQARQMVRELATGDDHVDLIKVVQDRGGPNRALQPITQDVLDAIVAEAHANRLMVAAHWGTFTDLQELLDAGVDELEHVDSRDLLGGWPDEELKKLVEREVPITATLTISEAALPPDVMPEVMQVLRQRVNEFYAAGGRLSSAATLPVPECASGPVSIVSWSCLSKAAWLRGRRCRQPPWMRPACWGRSV
jgi:imidazolonepropionase-like amidohydrolase